jgi:hypothetical protein
MNNEFWNRIVSMNEAGIGAVVDRDEKGAGSS